MKLSCPVQNSISIEPRTPPHHVCHAMLPPPIPMVTNIARRPIWPRDAVVLEQARLRRETRMPPAAPRAVAEEAHKNIDGVADVLEGDLVEESLRAVLADGVAQGTDTLLRVVDDPSVLRVVLDELEGICE